MIPMHKCSHFNTNQPRSSTKTMETVSVTGEGCLCAVLAGATVLIVVCILYGISRACEETVRCWERIDELLE